MLFVVLVVGFCCVCRCCSCCWVLLLLLLFVVLVVVCCSCLGFVVSGGWGNSCYLINFATISLVVLLTFPYFLQKNNIRFNIYMLLLLRLNQIHFLRRHQ